MQHEPTPEELALADRIAWEQWPNSLDYPERDAARSAALSAIQQTTELAAIMCDTGYSVEPGESCAVALRRNDHLKGEAHDA
jgi:hypothetical protein